jgi:hypothetical protein
MNSGTHLVVFFDFTKKTIPDRIAPNKEGLFLLESFGPLA